MKKILATILLTSAISLNSVFAQAAPSPEQQIKRSTAYTAILNSSAKDYDVLGKDLLRSSTGLVSMKLGLKAIFLIETVYWTWTAGKFINLCKGCGVEKDLFDLIGGIARVAATGTVGYHSALYKIDDMHGNINDELTIKKLEFINEQIKKSEARDWRLRDNKFKDIQSFRSLSAYERDLYTKQVESQLKALPQVYKLVQEGMNETISKMMDEYDPQNMSYLKRVISLGDDQIAFGKVVVYGAFARRDIAKDFAKFNDELIAEYKAVLAIQNN